MSCGVGLRHARIPHCYGCGGASGYSSDLTPSLVTSISHGHGPEKIKIAPPPNFFFLNILLESLFLILIFIFLFTYLFLLFRAAPAAYGGSQARDRIGATAAGLHYSQSNSGYLCPPQPQQHQIQAASVTYTTAPGNTRSLTH